MLKKKKYLKSYTTSRIKRRHYLSSAGVTKEHFYSRDFIFDICVLLTNNLNPFSLDQKLSDQNKHEMIYMLRKECVPTDFGKFTCK